MKKFFLFISVTMFLSLAEAQPITNGGFEMWYYGKPVGWTTDLHGTLTSIINFPIAVEFGEKTTDSHSGESAIMIHSSEFTVPVVGYTVKIPGILQLGEAEGFSIPVEDLMNIVQSMQDTTGNSFDFDNLTSLSSLIKILAKGVPCSKTPAAISMWIKYLPDGNDQMSIIALTKKDGQIVDFTYNTYDTREQYSQVGVNFNLVDAPCDTIQLIIMSSATVNKNSVLYVDDVEILDAPLDVSQIQKKETIVAPNPSTGLFNIKTELESEYNWEICDIKGKILLSGVGENDTQINAKTLTPGVYLVRVAHDNFVETHKIVIY